MDLGKIGICAMLKAMTMAHETLDFARDMLGKDKR
jgi:hypothetical protein